MWPIALAPRRGAGAHWCCRSLSARWLAAETDAAWPLLDSLTTWFSLLATWLAARAKLENWLYWIVIDGVLVFLFYVQQVCRCIALLNVAVHRNRDRRLHRLASALACAQAVPA